MRYRLLLPIRMSFLLFLTEEIAQAKKESDDTPEDNSASNTNDQKQANSEKKPEELYTSSSGELNLTRTSSDEISDALEKQKTSGTSSTSASEKVGDNVEQEEKIIRTSKV